MSSPFTPVAIGACDLLCRLDASSPSSSVPARIARSSGFESARGRTRMQVSVPSDFGHFTCHLHLTVDDNQATAVLGADWFKLFAEFVMSQPPLSSNGPGSSQSSNMQTSEDGPATNLQPGAHILAGSALSSSHEFIIRHLVHLYFENDSLRGDQIHLHLRHHGIYIDMCTPKHAFQLMVVHFMHGMCVGGRGPGCHDLHTLEMFEIQVAFTTIVAERARVQLIRECVLKNICSALYLQLVSPSLDEMTRLLVCWPRRVAAELNIGGFFSSLGRVRRPDLLLLSCQHGLTPCETVNETRLSIIHHIVSGACTRGLSSRWPACGLWARCLPKVPMDAADSAAILSVIISGRLGASSLLRTILDMLDIHHSISHGYDALLGLLKRHVFSLRRGPSVFEMTVEHCALYSCPEDIAWAQNIWPQCADAELLQQIRASFEQSLSDAFPTPCSVCSSCGLSVTASHSVSASHDEIDLSVLAVPPDWVDRGIWQGSDMDLLLAHEGGAPPVSRFCLPCDSSLRRGLLPKFALANHLFVGQVPIELQGLTVVEENMIALTRLKCMILQLKEERSSTPGIFSQRAYTGHSIYFHQNVQAFATVLPPPIDEILRYICVLFVGSHKPSQHFLRTHAKPLVVRAERVRSALHWLKAHNHLYRDIIIDHCLLDSIASDDGLDYPVEHIDSSLFETDTTSGYSRLDDRDNVSRDDEGNVIFRNLMVSDLEGSPSSSEMRLAALRHLQAGRPFVQLGHVSTPEPDYNNPFLFPSMFPTLYPLGVGGFEDPDREHPVGFQLHLRHLLSLADHRFQVHPSFIFTAFNILQRREVMRRTQLRVKRSDFANKARLYSCITPDAVERVSLMDSVRDCPPDSPEHAVQVLMRDVQIVNSTVMGSNSTRTVMREEIRSMIISLGSPCLFITINPADLYNPLVRIIAGEDFSLDSFVSSPTPRQEFFTQTRLVAENPVVAAQFFDIYMNTFFSSILSYRPGKEKSKGLFGYTKAFYGCAEAQGRGTLHCHCLVWLEGGLNPSEIKRRLVSLRDKSFEDRLITFLETNISTCIPSDPGMIHGVPSSAQHPCTVRPVRQLEEESESEFQTRRGKDLHNLVSACQKHSHSATCFKYCKDGADKICRFGLDSANYVPHTAVDYNTGEIMYQCLDGLVNNFNASIIELVRCNMDIKFIGSGQSAKAVLYYITDYVSKSQLKMHIVYNALQAAIRKLQAPNPHMASEPDRSLKDQGRLMLHKAANAIVSMQELSAQQVALYTIRGADNYTSHTFSRLFWAPFESFIDKSHSLSNTAMAGGSGPTLLNPDAIEEDARIRISPSNGLVLKGSQVADYVYRPPELDGLCLWDFAAHCQKCPLSKASHAVLHPSPPDEPSLNNPELPNLTMAMDPAASSLPRLPSDAILSHSRSKKVLHFVAGHSEAGTHGIRVVDHLHSAVPVLIGPGIPRRDQPEVYERYCRLMLILFRPWRTSSDLHDGLQTWVSSFDSLVSGNLMSLRHLLIMDNMQLLHDCRESRDLDVKSRHRARNPTCQPSSDGRPFPSDFTVDGEQDDPSSAGPSIPDDSTIDAHALELLQQTTDATLPVVKKGIISGLFTLDYTLSSPALLNASVVPTDEPTARAEAIWNSEYNHRKTSWRQDQIRLRSFLGLNGSSQDGMPIITAAHTDITSPPISPTPISILSSPPSSLSHIKQVADTWTLDPDQSRAFGIVAQHASLPRGQQLRMILSGGAGSGKSRVIKALTQFFSDRGENHRFRLAAFMGVAVHNIGGVTLHSALNLNTRRGSNTASSKSQHELHCLWTGIDYLFIDEVSMISCEFLLRVSDALIAATGIAEPFGGICVIFAGDMAQLPPVNETRLAKKTRRPQNSLSPNEQRKARGRALWLTIETVVVLSGNNRQSGDHNLRFRQLLSRLRYGMCNDEDYALLSSRVISRNIPRTTLNEFSSAPVIVCENAAKDAINERFARRFALATSQELHWYMAEDSLDRVLLSATSAHSKLIGALHSGATGNRLQRLPLVIGMPVMVTHNVSLESGVVNGTIGVIKSIHYKLNGDNCRVLTSCTVFLADNPHPPMPGLTRGEFPILPDTTSFHYRHERRGISFSIKRKQCPLLPAFAMTAHKSQGQSLPNVIVDLESCSGTEAPYVMVSRATSFDGLLVYRSFDKRRIRCNMSQDSREEEQRLLLLHRATAGSFSDNPFSSPALLPLSLPQTGRRRPPASITDDVQEGPSRKRRDIDDHRPRKRARMATPPHEMS